MSDCEIPEFYTETEHTARRQAKRKCCECRQPILPGEKYVSCKGKFDGDFFCVKQHLVCFHIARFVNYDLKFNDDGYNCIPFGEIKQALREAAPRRWPPSPGVEDDNDPQDRVPFGVENCVDVLGYWERWLSGVKEVFENGGGI